MSASIRMFTPSAKGVFIARPNRFVATVRAGEEIVQAHCPNPGRMGEILVPGREVFLEYSSSPKRKLRYTLAAARHGDGIVPLVSARANLAARELVLPRLFPDARDIRAEVKEGGSRFDFLVINKRERIWVEVKNCSLIEGETGLFPDAPRRGPRRQGNGSFHHHPWLSQPPRTQR